MRRCASGCRLGAVVDLMRASRITSIFVPGEGGRLEGALHMHDLLAAGLA